MYHVSQFLAAMEQKDGDGLSPHLTEDVVLKSPVLVDPISGNADAVRVLKVLLGAAETFHVRETIELEQRVIVLLEIDAGQARIEGVDDVRLDVQGLIQSMTITWRPLPSVVLMQQKIAAALGGKPMTLVPL